MIDDHQGMTPPHSKEAEQSVLGAVMLDDRILDDLIGKLEPPDFYYPQHQDIYQSMLEMSGQPIDAVTVGEKNPEIDFGYIIDIADNTPSMANALTYADIVKQKKAERDLLAVGNHFKELVQDKTLTHQERIDGAQSAFTSLSSEKQADTQVNIKQSMEATLASLERRLNGEDDGKQIKTGLSDIDNRIQGFRAGDLVLIGARPAMGKTTYMTNIAKHAARHHGKVMIFSLEMTHESITQRLISCLGRAHMSLLREPKTANKVDGFWAKVTVGATLASELNLVIDDQGGLSLPELCARARREHRKGAISMIMIDYIQKMNDGIKANSSNKNLEVGNISNGLKNLAKELDCPVVALSQLNRSLESRQDKRPNNSDLRDSGSLEQDADVIQFLYRDEIYDERSTAKGVMEVITSKFRDGEIGTDRLLFEGQFNSVSDMDAAKFMQQQQEAEEKNKPYSPYG